VGCRTLACGSRGLQHRLLARTARRGYCVGSPSPAPLEEPAAWLRLPPVPSPSCNLHAHRSCWERFSRHHDQRRNRGVDRRAAGRFPGCHSALSVRGCGARIGLLMALANLALSADVGAATSDSHASYTLIIRQPALTVAAVTVGEISGP
jgi:hypothetical protein